MQPPLPNLSQSAQTHFSPHPDYLTLSVLIFAPASTPLLPQTHPKRQAKKWKPMAWTTQDLDAELTDTCSHQKLRGCWLTWRQVAWNIVGVPASHYSRDSEKRDCKENKEVQVRLCGLASCKYPPPTLGPSPTRHLLTTKARRLENPILHSEEANLLAAPGTRIPGDR